MSRSSDNSSLHFTFCPSALSNAIDTTSFTTLCARCRSRNKHNQHRKLVEKEKHYLSADHMRVEQLILDAENNKVKLELAEAVRREGITMRKKEMERIRRKAEERKARMKKNVGKVRACESRCDEPVQLSYLPFASCFARRR